MNANIKEKIENIVALVEEYSGKNPVDAGRDERLFFNACSALVDAYRAEQDEQKRQEERDAKDDTIRTPEELEKKFQSMYKRQLLDASDKSNWREIVKWARDYDTDREVEELLDAFHKAHRVDKEDAMSDLFGHLLYNTDNDTYGVEEFTTVRLHMYGGGPAGGIEFTYDGDGGLRKAEAWHTEWFSEPVRYTLDDDEANILAEVYSAREHATGEW